MYVLILDDEPSSVNAIYRVLRRDYNLLKSEDPKEALNLIREKEVAVMLVDQRMPGLTGVEFIKQAADILPHAIPVLITGYADLDAVIRAVNEGHIYHYINKPWEPDELKMVVRQAMDKYQLEKKNRELTHQLQEENKVLQENISRQYQFPNIIGNSQPMQQVFSTMQKIIPLDVSVLITGETGTGKELIARAIHFNSPRKNRLFVAENCAALPETLLESKLFGHRKGAFTGAIKDQKGLFELADGGTIFLDEIADTSMQFQQRLLRVLQEGEITPLGSERPQKVNVRIITATNKQLDEEIFFGRFREDLYYRLNVIHIHLPPLRERKEDIPLLCQFFVEKYCLAMGKDKVEVRQDFIERLQEMPFPGNVRELENLIQRSIALLEPNQPLTAAHLDFYRDRPTGADAESNLAQILADDKPLEEIIEQVEELVIRRALKRTGGNISHTASLLGLSRPGLRNKIKKLGIDKTHY
ncbi:MAG: sigma-54 dependent transcriptional regulator [Calditrichia bacterium]